MIFERIRRFFERLFYGRCGFDNLNLFLILFYVVLAIINMIITRLCYRFLLLGAAGGLLTARKVIIVLEFLVILVCLLRAFSRNINKRAFENNKYLELKSKLFKKNYYNPNQNYYEYTPKKPKKPSAFKRKLNLLKEKFKNRKTHVYKACPNCKATIKLPKKKGEHTVCCPKCKVDFKVKI